VREESRVLDLTGAGRRRRRRDERLALLREFAAARGWTAQPALPPVVTRHPVPRLLEAGPAAAADLVLAGPWRSGARAELASVLVRPAGGRPPGARRGDDVLLLARLDVAPVAGRLVLVVTGGGLDAAGSTPSLLPAARPAVLRAVQDGVLEPGDCLALGEGSLALAGPWRPSIARPEALAAWFALLAAVAEDLTPPAVHAP